MYSNKKIGGIRYIRLGRYTFQVTCSLDESRRLLPECFPALVVNAVSLGAFFGYALGLLHNAGVV